MTTSLPVFGGGSGLDCRIGGPGSADSILLLLSALFLADGLRHLAALEVGHVVRLQVLQVERLTVGQLENMNVDFVVEQKPNRALQYFSYLVQDHVLYIGVPLILLGRISILFVFVVITNVCIGILLFFALLGGLDLDDGELVVRQLRDEDKVVG